MAATKAERLKQARLAQEEQLALFDAEAASIYGKDTKYQDLCPADQSKIRIAAFPNNKITCTRAGTRSASIGQVSKIHLDNKLSRRATLQSESR